jgi:curved DNA-binding protein CbpA
MTHYEVLGVAGTASIEQLRLAYRSRAREFHPDTPGAPADAQERMSQCNEAWAVLSDPDRRARYDADLYAARPGGFGRGIPSSVEERDLADEGRLPPGSDDDSTVRPASLVQVFGPVFVLMGILLIAGGFVALAPAMLISGVLLVIGGVYFMAATAVISLRSSGRRGKRGAPGTPGEHGRNEKRVKPHETQETLEAARD